MYLQLLLIDGLDIQTYIMFDRELKSTEVGTDVKTTKPILNVSRPAYNIALCQ